MPILRLFASRIAAANNVGITGTQTFYLGVVNTQRQQSSSTNKLSYLGSLEQRRGLKSAAPTRTPASSYLSDPENRGRRQQGVNFDQLGSWNNRLALSVNVEESIRHGRLIPKIDLEKIGCHSLQGRRSENEDRLCVEQLTNSLAMFAIYDGHGGSLAVEYCHAHMAEHIHFWLNSGETDLQEVLKKAFTDINNSFSRFLYNNFSGNEQILLCGTTATVCLLRSGIELVVAHVGDSRAALCREGQFIRLTHDHEPESPKEKKRIEEAGGRVVKSSLGKARVMGRLDMSRSIGDVDLKPYGVTAEPDTRSIEVKHGRDAFLVLTTDGIHKVLNSREVTNLINSCKDPQEACRLLLDQALMFGTEDNCSALVVPFGAWGKYASIGNVVNFALSRSLSSRKYV